MSHTFGDWRYWSVAFGRQNGHRVLSLWHWMKSPWWRGWNVTWNRSYELPE